MSSIRSSLLVFVVAVSAAGIAAASASAHEYKVVGGSLPQGILTKSGTTEFKYEVFGEKISFSCLKTSGEGEIKTAGLGTNIMGFEQCTLQPAWIGERCEIPFPFALNTTTELVGPEGGVEAELRGSGSSFAVLTFVSRAGAICPTLFRGTHAIAGTQKCKLPSIGTAKLEHEMACTAEGSSLTIKGYGETTPTVSFSTTEKIKLTSGKEWSAL
jgi:hypothetical protein